MLRFGDEEVPAMYSYTSNGSMPGHNDDGDTWVDSSPRLSLVKRPIRILTVLARALPVIPPLVREGLG